MPFRRKSHAPSSQRSEKENLAFPVAPPPCAQCDHGSTTTTTTTTTTRPLSPRLVRCHSDNSQRSASDFHVNKPPPRHGALSTQAKLSNLLELNASLVKEVAALRAFRSEAEEKLSQQESLLLSERRRLDLEVSHLKDQVGCLLEEKQSILASNQALKVNLESLQLEISEKLTANGNALAAAEELKCAANSEIERLTSNNGKLNEESRHLKDDVSRLISDTNVLLAEKNSNLMKIEELEAELKLSLNREKELNQLADMEKLAARDSKDMLQKMVRQIEALSADKEQLIRDHTIRMEEMGSMFREVEERYQRMCTNADASKNQLEMETSKFKNEITQFQVYIAHLETERKSILSRNEELQNEIMSSLDRDAELKQSIDSERRAFSDAAERMRHMDSDIKRLNAEKQQLIQEHKSQMEELRSRFMETTHLMQVTSTNADALKTQLEAEKSRHEAVVKSLEAAAHHASVEASARIRGLEDAFQNTLNDLRSQLAEEKKKSDLMRAEVSRMRVQIHELTDDRNVLRNSNMGLQELITELKQENQRVSNQLESECNSVQDLRESLYAAESDVKLVRADWKQLLENVERLKEEICKGELERRNLLIEKERILGERDATVSSLTSKSGKLSSQLEAARKDLATAQDTISSFMTEKQVFVSDAEKLRAALTAQLDQKEREMVAIQESMSSLQTANDALVKKINLIESSYSELAAKNDVQSIELSAEKKTTVAFEGQVENLRQLNAKLIEQITSLKNQIIVFEQQQKDIVKERQEIHEKVKILEHMVSEHQSRERDLQDEISKERKGASETINALQKQISEEFAGRARAEEKNVSLVDQVDSLCQLNDSLVNEVASLKDELAAVNGEKAEVLMAMEETCNVNKEMKKSISEFQVTEKSLTEQLNTVKAATTALEERLNEELKTRSIVERDSLVLKSEVEDLKTKVSQQDECLQDKIKQLDLITKEKLELESSIGEQRDMMSKLISQGNAKLYAEEKARMVAEESVSSLKIQVDDLRLLNSKLVEQVSSQKGQVEHLEFRISELLKEKREMDTVCKSNENLIDRLTKEREATEKSFLVTKDQFQAEKGARELVEDTIKKLTAEKKIAHDSIKALTSEVECLKVDKEKLLHENQKVVQLVADKERSVMEASAERFELEALVDTYQNLADQLQVKNATLQQEVAQLASEKETTITANEALSTDKLKLEDSLSILTNKYQNVTDQLEAEKETQAFVQSKYAADVDRLNAENNKLMTINNDLMSTIMVLENKVKHLALEDGKKEEQLLVLNKQLTSLRSSSNALECTLASQKTITESLQSANLTLENSLKTKDEATETLKVQLTEKCEQVSVLESQTRCTLESQREMEMRLKALQENFTTQVAAIRNECQAKESLYNTKNAELDALKQQLEVSAAEVVLLNNQLSATIEKHTEVKEALEKENGLKNEEIKKLTVQLQGITRKVTALESDLEEERGKNMSLESQVKQLQEEKSKNRSLEFQVQEMQNELRVAREVTARAEKQIEAGHQWESGLSEANRKISLLEAQLAELDVMASSDNAEQKTGMKGSSRTLPLVKHAKLQTEQSLSLVKMQSNADNCEATSIGSMQRQFSSSSIGSLERSAMTSKSEAGVGEKAKIMRLALPVVLISAASSVVIAGIQSYLRRIEN